MRVRLPFSSAVATTVVRLDVAGLDGAAMWTVFVLLAVPSLLFHLFIGKPILCGPFGLVLLAVAPFFRLRSDQPDGLAKSQGARLSAACAVAAFALTTIGGEGRLFPATADWLIRDAILHDLVQQAWPFAYRIDGKDWTLRAPLGMYLIPALCGKLAGLFAAHLALWAQNTVAIFVVLRILESAEFSATFWRLVMCAHSRRARVR